jgi:FMS-like tyrosine kinase 1
VDLNDPYLKMNMMQFEEGTTDYLAMLGSPDQMAPAPPTYVNGNLQFIRELNESDNQPDYLKMSPKTGSVKYNAGNSKTSTRESSSNFGYPAPDVSPTLQNNLNSSNDSKARTKKAGLPEERPMLSSQNKSNTYSSDSEGENSPDPKKNNKSQFNEMNPLDDSYINVSPIVFGAKDAFSNPSYVSMKTVNEKV